MTDTAKILRADHTGFSVSSLDDAIAFWTKAMGFTLARRGEMGGEFLKETTGVIGATVRMALVYCPKPDEPEPISSL